MECQVVLEYDRETRHYTAIVPGLPIVVDSKNKRTTIRLAREAVALYLAESGSRELPAIRAELVTVEV